MSSDDRLKAAHAAWAVKKNDTATIAELKRLRDQVENTTALTVSQQDASKVVRGEAKRIEEKVCTSIYTLH